MRGEASGHKKWSGAGFYLVLSPTHMRMCTHLPPWGWVFPVGCPAASYWCETSSREDQ